MQLIKRAVTIGTALILASGSAGAQWSGSVYGAAEVDTNESNLLLAGVSLSPGGGDIAPIFGLQAYRLSYKAGSATNTAFVFRPSAGLRFRLSPDASATASLGYAFADKDIPSAASVGSADAGDGVVLSGSLDLHPATSAVNWLAMASYNFGSESLWGRVRAPIRLRNLESGRWSFAPELSYINSNGFSSLEPAGVLLWRANTGLSFGAGIGLRMPNEGSNATVFKLEASYPLF